MEFCRIAGDVRLITGGFLGSKRGESVAEHKTSVRVRLHRKLPLVAPTNPNLARIPEFFELAADLKQDAEITGVTASRAFLQIRQ